MYITLSGISIPSIRITISFHNVRTITFQAVFVELLIVVAIPIPIIGTAVMGRIILKTLAFNVQQI
jgi:hypothetical protein